MSCTRLDIAQALIGFEQKEIPCGTRAHFIVLEGIPEGKEQYLKKACDLLEFAGYYVVWSTGDGEAPE